METLNFNNLHELPIEAPVNKIPTWLMWLIGTLTVGFIITVFVLIVRSKENKKLSHNNEDLEKRNKSLKDSISFLQPTSSFKLV